MEPPKPEIACRTLPPPTRGGSAPGVGPRMTAGTAWRTQTSGFRVGSQARQRTTVPCGARGCGSSLAQGGLVLDKPLKCFWTATRQVCGRPAVSHVDATIGYAAQTGSVMPNIASFLYARSCRDNRMTLLSQERV